MYIYTLGLKRRIYYSYITHFSHAWPFVGPYSGAIFFLIFFIIIIIFFHYFCPSFLGLIYTVTVSFLICQRLALAPAAGRFFF